MITFGPIPSRRLGRSLGINNIVSTKTCSFNCVYCQVGKTIRKIVKRFSSYEAELIYYEVCSHLQKTEIKPDCLTFVSNGEPTLDINLGRSIMLLKAIGIPVAVITNASLLFDKSVQDELKLADWVSLKVDTSTEKIWRKINRPCPGLDFKKHTGSLLGFAELYKGDLFTESMIIKGLNDSEDDVTVLAELISKINPKKAYISVPTRPPAEKWVQAPDSEKLNMVWQVFDSFHLEAELITGFEGSDTGYTGNIYEDILNISAVHPLREDTLEMLLKKDNADVQVIDSLMRQRLLSTVTYNGRKFYIREYHLNI